MCIHNTGDGGWNIDRSGACRTCFWNELTENKWEHWTREQKKTYRDEWKRKNKKESGMNTVSLSNISIASEQTSENVDKRCHLRWRACCIYGDKEIALKRKFGLKDQPSPTTPKEIVERIKAGQFVYRNESEADSSEKYAYDPYRGIRWRDPATVEDREGFNAAYEILLSENVKVNDAIMVKDPEAALTELQAWEASA